MFQHDFLRWNGLLTFVALVFSLSSTLLTVAQAQSDSNDGSPPEIVHEMIDAGERGETQNFVATVTDDIRVASVSLFYRFSGEVSYTQLAMDNDGADQYHVSLETSLDSSSPIEYYIEAQDAAGNLTLRGFSFDPLIRWLGPEREPPPGSGENPPPGKWIYVAGGLALIVLVALAGDSPPEPPPDTSTQTLTFNVTAPGEN